MDIAELDYDLPEALIANEPPLERDGGRLLVLDRASSAIDHTEVRALPSLVEPALWVVNDTRVIPARLRGHKPTGGRVELLLLERLEGDGAGERWRALGRASKGLRVGARCTLAGGRLEARIEARGEAGALTVSLVSTGPGSVAEAIDQGGEVPLPPYIRRAPRPEDRARYQTVYATHEGAVAAPTAGLHLSARLLDALEAAGHRMARVTLHVGAGTFAPVKVDRLEDHTMHEERWHVPEATAQAIGEARAEGRPVVAVGTTVVRTLETAADEAGVVHAGEGRTGLFITPPHRFRAVDALLTNFHLPRSTLLALVMAFAGIEPVRRAYAEAVARRYRFFSYGDAMLIRPDVRRPR